MVDTTTIEPASDAEDQNLSIEVERTEGIGKEGLGAEFSHGEKFVLTLILATLIPWAVAVILNLFVWDSIFLVVTGFVLMAYALTQGHVKNEELQVSIGGFFGQLTDWVIPPGHSWWIPKPFGKSLRQTNIGKLELNRRKVDDRSLTEVETSDDNQVEVSYYILYRIVDATRWARVENPDAVLEAVADRCVRWFVNEWPVAEITSQKETFSKYLRGEEVIVHKLEEPEEGGQPIGNDRPIRSDIKDVLMQDLGVEIINARVDDINPPPEYVKTRQREALEASQRRTETADTEAFAEQIGKLTEKGVTPDLAVHGTLVRRGDAEGLYVGGDAGDFTKGAAVRSRKSVTKGSNRRQS